MEYQKVGLLKWNRDRAHPGFTLIAPTRSEMAFLVDMGGKIVHRWKLPGMLASMAFLLPGGRLAVSCVTPEGPPIISAKGGRMMELDWDGNILWEYVDHGQHHDFRRLPNGNTLYIAWEEMKPEDAARVEGGIPGTEIEGKTIFEDVIREATADGEIVFEWATSSLDFSAYPLAHGSRRYGYAHCNTICPLEDGRILLCYRNMDMIAILNRDTGAFDWEMRDLTFGRPHDAQPVGDGNILLFANNCGNDMLIPEHSRVLEIDPATKEPVWIYKDYRSWTFHSSVMSGANRLTNGNTLVCESMWGRVFEVTPDGETVWDYVNPVFEGPFPISEGKANALFRSYRYAGDGPEIEGRLQ